MIAFINKNKNDLIYLGLLLFSVFIGRYYRSLGSVQAKKWVGSIIGLLLIVTVSGYNAIHPIFSALLGITIIKLTTVRYCHVATFFLMFGYLFFFRLSDKFGLPLSSGQTNLIEMIIVLRVVGVAFEINGSWITVGKTKKQENDDKKSQVKEFDRDDDFVEIINPCYADLFHYTFNYVGLLTGPYYRYRTFDDYFHLPFSKYVDCTGFTINTLKIVPLYVSLYLALSNLWPLEYILSEDHNNRNFLYRMLYPWALFAAFRQRVYSGMTLAESVCTSAGLGAYPVQGRNRTGHGPTVGYLKLKKMSEEEAKLVQYDFNTVESMDVWGCETVVTLRDSMKVWNKAVQYWVAMVVYKRFPVKLLKIHAALFVSVIWHGYHAGYFFCIYFCPFYLMAEDIYYKLYYKDATGTKKKVIGFIMWFLRSHSESYQAAAFLLLTFDRIWIYYSSVYHYWYGVWFAFLILGLLLNQVHKIGKPKKILNDTKEKNYSVKQ
ncbi:PREDICTED: lysophospholipid acyltransferase 7-like [Papilio xuthus]|uniref:Lysophospholipid acyltransferase 7 n=1 Tax=Papilio xuthus TaxID=66420 RepID=A0AAJ6ZBW2_PAPXU|nr:PREDICTED: lysophospholipid acyltransferase 7-like [Papilio xuthus]